MFSVLKTFQRLWKFLKRNIAIQLSCLKMINPYSALQMHTSVHKELLVFIAQVNISSLTFFVSR